ncbi:MAG: hypothetical protein ACI4Q3_10430 [Kiritimatiellia bacterium]
MKSTVLIGCVCCALGVPAADWFIDSAAGDDAAAGTSAASAWRTLAAHNRSADIKPGDRVLFKRGGLWRGTLRPKSGEPGKPVLYASYGSGAKPILQNSVDRTRAEDWEELKPGIWATKRQTPKVFEQVWDGRDCRSWSGSFQEGVKGSVKVLEEQGERFVRVTCTEQPKRARHLIQVWGPAVDNLPEQALLRMKVRASKPFAIGQIGLSLNRIPWTCGHQGPVQSDGSAAEIGAEWRTVQVPMTRRAAIDGAYFHFSIGDVMPAGGTLDFVPVGIWRMETDPRAQLPFDVGIFICDHGAKWGVKKWDAESLARPLDYWDDRTNERVLVRWDGNPAKAFRSIELAFTRHVVDEGGCHDVVYDGLAVRYGAAHGFGGGSTRNITIRNCDIYWIGGGLQYWRVNAKGVRYPVRFGNGIEFWGACHNNLVTRNRLWQIYDAALTNQTKDDPRWETDVVWRDNVIWQAEYSFEYWNHDLRSFTGNVLFEHNTCVDAGGCWSHDQRPNPNGAHLMFYDNAAPTTNFVVRNNVFVRTTDRSTRMFNDWRARPDSAEGLTIDHNLYFIPENALYEYHVNNRERHQKPGIRLEPARFGAGAEEFARYQAEMAMDAGSVYGEPAFVDEARRDYRLKPGSAGSSQATDGGPMGARDMPGLDADQSVPAHP